MVLPVLVYLGIAAGTFILTQTVDYFTDKPEQQNIIEGGQTTIGAPTTSALGTGLSIGTLAILGIGAYLLLKK